MRTFNRWMIVLWLAVGLRVVADENISYPPTAKSDFKETLHGTVIEDPYRWLEDDNSDQTKAWVEAQNKVTFDYLKSIPQREGIRQRLTTLWNY